MVAPSRNQVLVKVLLGFICILFGLFFIKEGLDGKEKRFKPYYTFCTECHDECPKSVTHSSKCLNCHGETTCEKGSVFKRQNKK